MDQREMSEAVRKRLDMAQEIVESLHAITVGRPTHDLRTLAKMAGKLHWRLIELMVESNGGENH